MNSREMNDAFAAELQKEHVVLLQQMAQELMRVHCGCGHCYSIRKKVARFLDPQVELPRDKKEKDQEA